MLFLLGPARFLGSSWLCFHLLLWTLETPLGATSEGELCRSWTSGVDGAFQCPQSPDGADAKFCCGTCRTPYCCPSAEDRLDQMQCGTGQQEEPITDVPQDGKPPFLFRDLPEWALVIITIIGFCLSHIICSSRRRLRCWWRSQNQDQHDAPTGHVPSDCPPSSGEHQRPFLDGDPPGTKVLSPSSTVPRAVQQGHANAGYQDEAQQGPGCISKSAPAMVGTSSQACGPSSVSSPSYDESDSGRSGRAASVGRTPTRYHNYCALDSNDLSSHSAIWFPYDSQGLTTAMATSQGSPQVQLVKFGAIPPKCSAIAASSLDSDERPPSTFNVSPDLHGSPHADPAVAPGAKDEATTLSPPGLLCASAAGPILDPVLKADELVLPPTGL